MNNIKLWKIVLKEMLAMLTCFKNPQGWSIIITVYSEKGNSMDYENIKACNK